MEKLWAGRFAAGNSELMEEFNASIFFDREMYREDIRGSMAHARMLEKIGILSQEEGEKIRNGLKTVLAKMDGGELEFHAREEDIHTKVEQELKREIGDLSGKLHTARSRNDQVCTDLRLYLRGRIVDLKKELLTVLEVICQLAEEHQDVILPGTTHFQPAQPITLSFYFLSYFFMLERDLERLSDCFERVNRMPLGSGAMAGVNYPIDREMVAKELGFKEVLPNALDAVSDRDFLIELSSHLSIIMMHLSRLCDEFIVYNNPAFGFIEMDDAYSTGSSIMPNKKNPDSLELIRGKSGRVYGHLMSILTIMKGIPLAYNKDLQEDKEGIFDSLASVNISLRVMGKVLGSLRFSPENMLAQCERGYLQATDLADYLVMKGLPFRDAHSVCAKIVQKLSSQKKPFSSLNLEAFKEFSPLFEEDIFSVLKMENVIANKKSLGSTSKESVKQQLVGVHKKIAEWKKTLASLSSD